MNDELLGHFATEARELMLLASEDLQALERAPDDAGRIDSAFRALHTLKGSVGLFDLAPLGRLLHEAEDVLSAFREVRLRPDTGSLAALLACVDAIEGWIDAIAQSGCLPQGAETACVRLGRAIRAHLPEADEADAPAAPASDWLPGVLARDPDAVANAAAAGHDLVAVRYVPDPDCFFRGDDPLAVLRGIPDLRIVHVALRDPEASALAGPFVCNLLITCVSGAPLADIRQRLRLLGGQVAIAPVPPAAVPPEGPASEANSRAQRTLRIDAGRVDMLAGLAGELIIAKNRLAHLASAGAKLPAGFRQSLADSQADLERIAGGIQRGVMGLRLVRLDVCFRRLPRLVRDTAARLGKQVRLEISGGDTEADKEVVDALFDPLLHLLRNAIDHGIEDAASRAGQGKPAAGVLSVGARAAGHEIVVTVSDDGQGIEPAFVRDRAIAKGLVTREAAERMDDDAVLGMIFTPGFSTARSVTEISGRGVGLDAVRRFVGDLGGSAGVSSIPLRGTSVRLTVPLSVALSTVIIVRAADQDFGIPFDAVVETARLSRSGIQKVHGGRAVVWRDRTLPLMSLTDILALETTAGRSGEAKLLVVDAGGQVIGLEVDGFAERADVVVRKLGGLMAGVRGASGTALLGDGRILIILNLADLV